MYLNLRRASLWSNTWKEKKKMSSYNFRWDLLWCPSSTLFHNNHSLDSNINIHFNIIPFRTHTRTHTFSLTHSHTNIFFPDNVFYIPSIYVRLVGSFLFFHFTIKFVYPCLFRLPSVLPYLQYGFRNVASRLIWKNLKGETLMWSFLSTSISILSFHCYN